MKSVNKVEIKSFIFKITEEHANEILDKDICPPIVGLICEHGAIIPDTAEIIVEFDANGNCYVASNNMLVRSPDKIFCYLKHDVSEASCSDDLPKFTDVFKIREL